MIDTRKLTKLLIKYDLNPEEFYVIDALYKKEFKALKEYIDSRGAFGKQVLQELENKGYIEYFGKDNLYNIFDILITDKFYDSIYIDEEIAGREFFAAYPSFIHVDGKPIMSKKCDKDLYTEKYCRDIGYDKEKHQRILKGLEVAKKRGLINMAIRNFIDSQMYDVLEELSEKYTEGGSKKSFRKQI